MPARKANPVSLYVPDNLPRQGRRGQAVIGHIDLDDPMPDADKPPGQKIRAAVNTRRDVLMHEYAHGRITWAALLQGRLLQAALELRGASGQAQWSDADRVDAASLVDLAIARGVDRAILATRIIDHCRRTLGKVQGEHVVMCLRGPADWREIAAAYGKTGERSVSYYAQLFRDGIEAIAASPP